MSDLFGSSSPNDYEARRDTLKDKLSFGDVATALGLSGSTPHGWDCPACCGEQTLREGSHNKGGKCKSCDAGFDIISLIQTMENVSFASALDRLESILADLDEPQAERLL